MHHGAAASRPNGGQAGAAVATHSGEDDADRRRSKQLRHRYKQKIGGRSHAPYGRRVVQYDPRTVPCTVLYAAHPHVPSAGRDIHVVWQQRFAIACLGHRELRLVVQPARQSGGKSRRHMLRNQYRSIKCATETRDHFHQGARPSRAAGNRDGGSRGPGIRRHPAQPGGWPPARRHPGHCSSTAQVYDRGRAQGFMQPFGDLPHLLCPRRIRLAHEIHRAKFQRQERQVHITAGFGSAEHHHRTRGITHQFA